MVKIIHNQVAEQGAPLGLTKLIDYGEKKLTASHTEALANRHVGVELGHKLIRQGVGHA
jgi:hypothetical protein